MTEEGLSVIDPQETTSCHEYCVLFDRTEVIFVNSFTFSEQCQVQSLKK